MRARLFLLLLTLLACVIAALQVPLGFSYAVSAQQTVFPVSARHAPTTRPT